MTALFIVLFVDQFLREKNHFSSMSGIVLSFVALRFVGNTYFMPVTLILLVVILQFHIHRGNQSVSS